RPKRVAFRLRTPSVSGDRRRIHLGSLRDRTNRLHSRAGRLRSSPGWFSCRDLRSRTPAGGGVSVLGGSRTIAGESERAPGESERAQQETDPAWRGGERVRTRAIRSLGTTRQQS